MSGTNRIVDVATLLVADRIQNISGFGAHAAVTFLLNVTAITRTTGSLEVTMIWSSGGSNNVNVAFASGITATGLIVIPLLTGFDSTRQAIPEPTIARWQLIGDATSVSGSIIACYGD